MLGCYDFCGHYEWTFEWLRTEGGDELVNAIGGRRLPTIPNAMRTEIIVEKGIVGMQAYWAHTLEEEGAGYRATSNDSSSYRYARLPVQRLSYPQSSDAVS